MTVDPNWIANERDTEWSAPEPDPRPLVFHRGLPDYAPSPLVELPAVARELGLGRVFAKVEAQRLGLPAFKALGASWAVRRALDELGTDEPVTIVAATDGNHGRAVARFTRRFGQRAVVFVPDGVHPLAMQAIGSEGADVVHVPGTYDDAVRAAAELGSSQGHLLVQDTAWDGYEEIPGWIVDGYATMFAELDDQLHAAGLAGPALVAVPTGVGSLLQAAIVHHRRPGAVRRTAVVSVEPDSAACVHASVAARRPVTISTGTTVMAGLNCGTVSSSAWPSIDAGLDAALVTDDDAAISAIDSLAQCGVDAGPCGAATLAALRGVLGGDERDRFLGHIAVGDDGAVVLLVTESSAANPHGRQ